MKDLRIDEKGKFFTTHTSKLPILVVGATREIVFRGTMHLCPDNRLKDELNQSEHFIALTDARIYALDGKTELYAASVILLNKELIAWVIPQNTQDNITPKAN